LSSRRVIRVKGLDRFATAVFLPIVLLLTALYCCDHTAHLSIKPSPIEEAALTVANDLSSLVIYDHEFGLVGLVDRFPPSSDTLDNENKTPIVIGINTLFGSVNQNLIRASERHDDSMRDSALRDYQFCLEAQRQLTKALENAVQPYGHGTDAYGRVINPTEDAIRAFNARVGFFQLLEQRTLVPGTLKLSIEKTHAALDLRKPLIVKVQADESYKRSVATSLEPDCRRVVSRIIISVDRLAALAQAHNTSEKK
jgi:hypothetical protein